MINSKILPLVILTAVSLLVAGVRAAEGAIRDSYDVVIAGAGTGGCGAAIAAARLGASVLLLEETDWIGGQMNAAAVTSMDEGGTLVRQRGIYRELVQRIEKHYDALGIDCETAYWHRHICVEPRVGRKILREMLADAGRSVPLDLSLRSRVTKVIRRGDVVTGVEIEIVTPGGRQVRTIASKVLIDATEWGDVLPLTGARYRVGNCTSDGIDPKRRMQDNTWTAVVKQYPQAPPAGFVMTQPPPGYEKMHARFVQTLGHGKTIGFKERPWTWATFIGYRGMPDSSRSGDSPSITRTHLNFNNDHPSYVAEVEDPAQRLATDRAMRLRTLQLIYYIQNTLGFKDWAVADDEGYDTPYNRAQIDAWLKDQPELEPYRAMLYHFPVIPYVRESRRLIGVHTLVAKEIARGPRQPTRFETVVAIGDYPIDLHASKNTEWLELELETMADTTEEAGGHASGPFAIPFECFIPEKIDGLLAAEKNISQSRLANGATRLQPHTMNMGQAAGAIAALAIRHDVAPRDLEPVLVQRVLLEARDTLNLTPLRDVTQASGDWPAIQLVTVHGMLPLENDRFSPQRPLAETELRDIVKKLGGAVPTVAAGPVTRGMFAAAVREAMAAAKVTLAFAATDAQQGLPITRSEAAQVLADFLELRALARMTRTPQRLTWDSVRPASAPSLTDATSTLDRDLQKLVRMKIIDDAAYWMNHATAGQVCDGARVAALMARAARVLEPAAEHDSAVAVFARNGIISTPEYWIAHAVPGRQCHGNNVATVIRNLARHPSMKR